MKAFESKAALMNSALLVIDVQRSLCEGEKAAFDVDRVIDRINVASARARAAGVPVILVRHEEDDGSLRYASDGWQLAEALATAPEDVRMRKRATDSFHQTELHRLLQERGASRLVVCALQSDFCIDSTIRRALALGDSVTLPADGRPTVDNGVLNAAQIAAHHAATLANIRSFGPCVTPTRASELDFAVDAAASRSIRR